MIRTLSPRRAFGLLLQGNQLLSRRYGLAAASIAQDDQPKSRLVQALPTQGNMVRVVWDDCVAGDFHGIWLRDNCPCARCRDPGTQQRILDSPSLSLETKPRDIQCHPDFVEVHWNDTEQHKSSFCADWLREHVGPFLIDGHSGFSTKKPLKKPSLPAIQPWDGKSLAVSIELVPYDEMMSGGENSKGLLKVFENLHRFGLAFVRGVPKKEGMVMQMAKYLSVLKETSYGEMFDVVQDPGKVAHLANTGLALDLHTDLNYREKSPGLQFLLSLELAYPDDLSQGELGLSRFVDGVAIGEWLRRERPADFHMLSSTPVTFSIQVNENSYTHQVPIFCLGQNGVIEEVHMNNRTMAPLQLSPNSVLPFYAAYKALNDKIRSGEYEYQIQLVPGDMVVFNNRRVFHGRGKYNPHHVRRRLQGCYGDHDEFMSKYRALLRRLHAMKTSSTPEVKT